MWDKLKSFLFPSLEELEQRKQELRRRLDEKKAGGVATLVDLPRAPGPIELVSSACPHCDVAQNPPPQRRRKCRDCGETIYIWTDREARKKYLVTEVQRQQREQERRNHQWKELSQIVRTAMRRQDWQTLQDAYQEQADILFHEGRSHRHVAIEAARAQLRHCYEIDIPSVKVLTSGDERVCEYCARLDGKVFSIEDALEQIPIPGPTCIDGSDKNPHGGRCRCTYIAVIPRRSRGE